jgi:alpha-tubulin suppressor-like RCC1 family protein
VIESTIQISFLRVISYQLVDTISVACGRCHTVAVTATGSVYAWGCAEHGKLGLGSDEYKLLPTLVESLQNLQVSQVHCGEDFTLAVCENKTIYAWGSSQYGELGLGNTETHDTPVMVTSLQEKSNNRKFSENSEAYGQELLESTLRSQFKMYRPTLMLERCRDWNNPKAASTVS